jgi:hypothetical protein
MPIEEGSDKNTKEQIANFFINSHILIHVSFKVSELLTRKHIDLSNVGVSALCKCTKYQYFLVSAWQSTGIELKYEQHRQYDNPLHENRSYPN